MKTITKSTEARIMFMTTPAEITTMRFHGRQR